MHAVWRLYSLLWLKREKEATSDNDKWKSGPALINMSSIANSDTYTHIQKERCATRHEWSYEPKPFCRTQKRKLKKKEQKKKKGKTKKERNERKNKKRTLTERMWMKELRWIYTATARPTGKRHNERAHTEHNRSSSTSNRTKQTHGRDRSLGDDSQLHTSPSTITNSQQRILAHTNRGDPKPNQSVGVRGDSREKDTEKCTKRNVPVYLGWCVLLLFIFLVFLSHCSYAPHTSYTVRTYNRRFALTHHSFRCVFDAHTYFSFVYKFLCVFFYSIQSFVFD